MDAALYQSLYLHDQPASLSTLKDCQRLGELMERRSGACTFDALVGEGILALDDYASNVVISGITLTDHSADHRDLPISIAEQWMNCLLDHPSALTRMYAIADGEFQVAKENSTHFKTEAEYLASPRIKEDMGASLEELRRAEAEPDLAAMVVAAHLYQFKHHRWPANASELASELSKIPIDPFSRGKQPLGYLLVAHGLPEGGDRPLVYSRCNSKDGLFYRSDAPEYGFYVGDGSGLLKEQQKQGGEFRDVARWDPAKAQVDAGPTTRPLAQ